MEDRKGERKMAMSYRRMLEMRLGDWKMGIAMGRGGGMGIAVLSARGLCVGIVVIVREWS